jgi:hypothetical protein
MWRCDKHHKKDLYQLDTVTFSTTPAAFMVTRALLETTKFTQDQTISMMIRDSFFFDDMLFSCNELNEITITTINSYEHLDKFGMFLTEILAYDPLILKDVDLNRLSDNNAIQFNDG